MKIDISTLNEGDLVYYKKGDEYKTGEFIRKTGDILDLQVLLVKAIGFPVYDEIVDGFLITKDEYDKKSTSRKTQIMSNDYPIVIDKIKEAKPVKELKTKAPKAEKVPKIKTKVIIDSSISVKPTLKGLQSIAEADGVEIGRNQKWWDFYCKKGDVIHSFVWKREVKELFSIYIEKGYEGLLKL